MNTITQEKFPLEFFPEAISLNCYLNLENFESDVAYHDIAYHLVGGYYFIANNYALLELENNFKLWNKEDIQKFIEIHPEINTYLPEAFDIINKHCKPAEKLEIRVISDPESVNEDYKTFFLYVPLKISPQEAIDMLEKIDKILFEELQFNSEIFNIDIKFR